jgi:hypothetical protein
MGANAARKIGGYGEYKMDDSKEGSTESKSREFLIAFLPRLTTPKPNSRGDKSQDQRPDESPKEPPDGDAP